MRNDVSLGRINLRRFIVLQLRIKHVQKISAGHELDYEAAASPHAACKPRSGPTYSPDHEVLVRGSGLGMLHIANPDAFLLSTFIVSPVKLGLR